MLGLFGGTPGIRKPLTRSCEFDWWRADPAKSSVFYCGRDPSPLVLS